MIKKHLIIATLCFIMIAFFLLVMGSPLVPEHLDEPVPGGRFVAQSVWVAETQERVLNTPVIKDELVFVRTEKAVYALSGMNGETLWRTEFPPVDPYYRTPQFAVGDVLVVPGGRAAIVAFSPSDGKILWQDDMDYSTGGFHVQAIAFQDELVYVARHNSDLVAYNQQSGQVIWRAHAPGRNFLRLSVDNGQVYFSVNHKLWSYESLSGKPILETEFYTYTGPILVEGNILYLLSGIIQSGIERIGVVAIDLATFSNIWDLTLLNYDILNENALTTHGDTIFVSGDGLYAIDKSTGAVRWDTHNKEVGITGHPVVIDQIVYVRNRAGKLFAFDIDTGEEIGFLQLLDNGSVNNPYETGPAVFGDLLIIPFGDNRIYAYRP